MSRLPWLKDIIYRISDKLKRDGSSRENKDRRKGKSRGKGGKDCRNKWDLNKNNGGLSRDSCKDKDKGKKDKKIR